jgi:hypothetical protein
MSRCNEEMVDHLFLHCPRVAALWSYVFHSFGVQWVLPGRVLDLLFGWRNWFGKHSSDIWNLLSSCLMWTVWREHNWSTFEDMESLESQFLESFANLLFDWSWAWGFTTSTSIASFIDSLCLTYTPHSL